MNTNGNICYISKSDNPDQWSTASSDKTNGGCFALSDFANKGGISNGWGTANSDCSGTFLNTTSSYTGRASSLITIKETVSGNCVGLYIPICFYASSVPAHTTVTF